MKVYLSFIYDCRHQQPVSAYPPHCASHTGDSNCSKPLRCTWHFNPQGLSAFHIAAKRRALLPHVFTLTQLVIGYWLMVIGYWLMVNG